MKTRGPSFLSSWLKRKPKVTYIVCPSCQQQTVADAEQPEVTPTTSRYPVDEAHRRLARQAMESAVAVDNLRRRRSEGDPLKDQALRDIEAGFMQNVADVGRRLRRLGGEGDHL
jgi:hypothetical protein